ncbi:MAG: hypothetical protein AAB955_01770 [Patescibacteria group bacterium]
MLKESERTEKQKEAWRKASPMGVLFDLFIAPPAFFLVFLYGTDLIIESINSNETVPNSFESIILLLSALGGMGVAAVRADRKYGSGLVENIKFMFSSPKD